MSLPPKIRKLDEAVVNRIAAGEVIQRPANALKELLENSLDAKSTNISVILKNGGLKVLQIQDNGIGIRKEDLDIVCERFTTSKLKDYEDLSTIATFGFRGEALASVSHVAHLTITTKTADELCAFRASYEDGKLKVPPKPVAATQGTTILVEDLFYNISTRKKAFKNTSEEHARVADVITKYAIHNPLVGFNLKKFGDNLSEIKTNPNSTHIDNIKMIYGNNIARELLEVESTDDAFKFKLHGLISNVNYSAKKQIFILFINNRLVDSVSLRKAVEGVYSIYLGKGGHPFTYLSLELDPRTVDVNVHPTKHEVHFLNEEEIVGRARAALEARLLGANSSRTFYAQSKLPTVDLTLKSAILEKEMGSTPAQKDFVRTDSSTQKLDRFLTKGGQAAPTTPQSSSSSASSSRRQINLTSILSLRLEVEELSSLGLRDLMANSTFVGAVDPGRALIQKEKDLFLVNTRKLLEELFYQIMLYDFGNFGIIKLKESLSVFEVCLLGLSDPGSNWNESDGPREDLAEAASTLLASKADMLADYFSIEITDGGIVSLPLLLDSYIPDLSRLPLYLLRLACDVDWTKEKACFKTFCRETAKFYSFLPVYQDSESDRAWDWTLEHILYPAIKAQLLPPEKYAKDGTVLSVAHLPDLYKVFERC